MSTWILFGGAVLAFGVAWTVGVWIRSAWRRAETPASTAEPSRSSEDLLLGDLTPMLADQVPIAGERLTELQADLREGGFYRRTAAMEFAAARFALTLLPLLLAFALVGVLDEEYTLRTVAAGAVLAVLGFCLPRVYLTTSIRHRKRRIEAGLPVAVDLLALGLLSGQNVISAMRKVSQVLGNSYPELATELEIVRGQAELNTLPHALFQWADRVNIDEVRNMAVLLTHSDQFGTDASSRLLELADHFRATMTQRADAQAGRAAFWLLFPTVLCLWIPAAAVLVAPVYFEFVTQREQVQQSIQESRDSAGNVAVTKAKGKQ